MCQAFNEQLFEERFVQSSCDCLDLGLGVALVQNIASDCISLNACLTLRCHLNDSALRRIFPQMD